MFIRRVLLSAGALLMGATPSWAQSTIPARISLGSDVADALILLELAEEQPNEAPTTRPTTGPASQASERLSKFRTRYNRTPVTALQALSAIPDPKMDEAARFRQDVQAGRWDQVGMAIATFPPDQAKTLYRHLLTDLMVPPPQQPQQGQSVQPGVPVEAQPRPPGAATIFISPEDVLGIIAAAPGTIEADLIDPLGQLLARAIAGGGVIEPMLDRLGQGVGSVGGSDPVARQRAAAILVAANRPIEAAPFLPALNPDLPANDIALLELHSRCLTSLSAREDDKTLRAWEVTRVLLVHKEITTRQREAAMARAMELLPRLPKPAVTEWLAATFSGSSDQAMAVLSGAGTVVSQNFLSRDMVRREQDLLQQKTVVEQLLTQTSDVPRWTPLLEALAALWMQEADYARTRPTQRQMQQQSSRVVYDEFGNPQVQQVAVNQPMPIDPAKMLAAAPSEKWMNAVSPTLRAAIRTNLAHMQFKNDTPQEAMPIIETLAASHPKVARDLCAELLRNLSRVWSAALIPVNRSSSSYIMSASGSYMSVSQNVVLTRLAQVRNLSELSTLLRRIEKLPGEPVDANVVVQVFVSAHSPAEVFKLEDVQSVFGSVEQMGRDPLYTLSQQMRQRLATSWRLPAVQQQQQTKRTDKETEAEVTRGYQLVTDLLKQRLAKEPDWKLMLIRGLALFDWAEFDYGRQVELAIYTARRDEAFGLFDQSARLYSASLDNIRINEQSPMVFTQWFNAALGASDLSALTRQSTPSPTQIQLLRTALFAVPEPHRDRHVSGFGRFLTDSVLQVKPELKHRFLTTGIALLGEHESARDAQVLVRYYEELLKEIELHAQVDGDPVIGHTRPFGLHLMVRHTQTLGRESGGFGKYLSAGTGAGAVMNSNGQPVNYRDEFEKKIREALVERFNIISIAWHETKVEPLSYGRPGWRQTPLAYLLLKPKDASVDKIPPIQLDLDLVDRQGTVILPVTSQVVLVDSRPETTPARPVSDIEITQILDQRDVQSGQLTLDIKATGKGLLPDLADLVDLEIPGFKIDKTNDLGLVINRLDVQSGSPSPMSEHSWLINLSAQRQDDSPLTFKFPQPRAAGTKVVYRQYSDADVSDVDPQLAVAGLPIRQSRWWVYVLVIGIVGFGLIAILARVLRHRSGEDQIAPLYRVPTTITPFTVIELLRRINDDSSLALAAEHRQRLNTDIAELQQSYFAPDGSNGNGNGHADLSAIAARWVQQAGRS